jgi:(p)ppGpp synthase/HD superfamily hydrolase
MNFLEKAMLIAFDAHRGSKDKAGAPYVLHPLWVMWKTDTEEEAAAAVLHDVVEDSEWTLEMLKMEGIPDDVVEAVDALTRRRNEPYKIYILRASKNPMAAKIKKLDLTHNLDKSRIPSPTKRDIERWEKYGKALKTLVEITEERY